MEDRHPFAMPPGRDSAGDSIQNAMTRIKKISGISFTPEQEEQVRDYLNELWEQGKHAQFMQSIGFGGPPM